MAKTTTLPQFTRQSNNSVLTRSVNAFKNALVGARNSRLDFAQIAKTLNSGKRLGVDSKINAKQALNSARVAYGDKLVNAQESYVKLLNDIRNVRKPDGTPLTRGQFRKIADIADQQFSKILSGEKIIDMKRMDNMLNKLLIATETATTTASGTALGIEAIRQTEQTKRDDIKQRARTKSTSTNMDSDSSSADSDLDNPGSSPIFSIV